MCGIVGAASSTFLTTLDQKIFVQLLTVDVLRGAHSTGVMWADSYASKGEFIKAVGDPYTFFRAEGVKETLDGLKKPSFLVGHNRYATQGKINVENAHPFNHKHITMVHNGTLRAWDSKNFDVDSKWACHMLAEEGVQALVDKATTKCAYAYVWHNENDHTLNFLRNHERPLYYYLEHGDLFFASEELMLEWVLTRNSHWQPLVIKEFRAHHHYCFNLKDLTYSVKEVRPTQTNYFPSYTDNAKVNRETVHGLFYKFETHNYSANDTRSDDKRFGRATGCLLDTSTLGYTNVDLVFSTKTLDWWNRAWAENAVDGFLMIKGELGTECNLPGLKNKTMYVYDVEAVPFVVPSALSRDEWLELTETGCANCDACLDERQRGDIIVLPDHSTLCPACSLQYKSNHRAFK